MLLHFRRLNRRLALVATLLPACIPLTQAADPKTAEEVYKNITQLKGTPADQLMPAMQFIAVSLGVECSFCHVQLQRAPGGDLLFLPPRPGAPGQCSAGPRIRRCRAETHGAGPGRPGPHRR